MAWETRARGGAYYTRSHKIAGQVYREYVGTGPLAELAAAEDELHREAREQALADRRTERERLAALDGPLLALDARVEALYRAALLVAGYHRHQRGDWRRRRAQRSA